MKQILPKGARLIPAEAKKVFSGGLFEVYQWQQERFDGSFATFEMLKRPDTVLIVAVDDDENVITLNEQQAGLELVRYSLPGGRVDAEDSSLLEAAKREMREETGLEFAEWTLFDVTQPQHKIEWFVYMFVAEKVSKRGTPSPDPGEKIEVVPVPYGEFIEHSSDAKRSQLLQQYRTLAELREAVRQRG